MGKADWPAAFALTACCRIEHLDVTGGTERVGPADGALGGFGATGRQLERTNINAVLRSKGLVE